MKKLHTGIRRAGRINHLVFLLIILPALSMAQADSSSVSGKIAEQTTREPMQFVNVALFHSGDSAFVTGAVSDAAGSYRITGIADGKYYVQFSLIGFKTSRSPAFDIGPGNRRVDLGETAIQTSGQVLGEVEISDEKNLMETSIDRKIYNVDKDISSKSGSASDVLTNVPSVTVDGDGAVSLRGSPNVTILINGKPSPLMRANAAAALQAIPASTIQRIEIITNPSAKYKPDGTAGIINIVLKKESEKGFNGTLIANTGNDDRYNGTLLMNYNFGKVNLSGTYGFRRDFRKRKSTDTRILTDSASQQHSYFNLTGETWYRPVSHTAQLGLDYSPNNKTTFGLHGNYFHLGLEENESYLTVWNDDVAIINDFDRFRINRESEDEKELTASFERKFKKEDHELSAEVNIADLTEQEDNRFTNTWQVPQAAASYDNTRIQLFEKVADAAVDYAYPLNEDAAIEAGYEGTFIRQDFLFSVENFDDNQNVWITDLQKTNEFVFRQDVHALYFSYEQSIEDFGFLAGLRGEQALITSKLVTFDSVVPNNYFSLYPTAHLSYELGDRQEIQLSYSRRVERPEGDEMNPFPEYENPRDITSGNPNLKPEQIHSVDLGFQHKGEKIVFVPGLYYRHKYNAFTEISRYINDSTLLTTFENLSTEKSGGIEFILSGKVKKLLSFNLSANGYFNRIDASNLGYSGNKSAFSWTAKLGTNINVTKSTVMQLNSSYRSSMLTPQGRYLPVFVLNAGLRQNIFRNKAALTLTVSDVFNTLHWTNVIDTPEMYQEVTSKRKSQIAYIGFTYNFGRTAKKQSDDLRFDEKM